MRDGVAETIAEAAAQSFTLPEFAQWREFAGRMNGYSIATELDLDFHAWGAEQERLWQETTHWDIDVLHLRLMLFYAFRADYMTGYTYTEHDEMADSLLSTISLKTGLSYMPLEPE